MTIFLIGSDFYTLYSHFNSKKKFSIPYPFFSIVIPAFNEEKSIEKCLSSLLSTTYPQDKFEIIVVNDGSTDDTYRKTQLYKKRHCVKNVTIVSQTNLGKAHALNNGIKNYAKGDLVMCLDADSYLAPDALEKAAQYFQNKKVVALAANVKIIKNKGLLNLLQQLEYIICYQMKRAQTFFNIEYIIGGIGSTFRKSYLEQIGFYDTDTVTEDIDLTMKMLQKGNKNIRVIYGADVIAYTQSVLSISDLIRQRFRWKWGRYQTFFKNRSLFFTSNSAFTKGLTWLYLPYALFADAAFFFEPVILLYLISIIYSYHDLFTLFSTVGIITFYRGMNIVAEDTLSLKEKIHLAMLTPITYFFFYLLSYVEYIALLKACISMHTLQTSTQEKHCNWQPVHRIGYIIS